MKNIPRKFTTDFVKPLYRKVKPKIGQKDRCVYIDVDNTIELCGDGLSVKRNTVSENTSNTVLVEHLNNTNQPSLVLGKRGRKPFRKEENCITKNKLDDIYQNKSNIKPTRGILQHRNMLGIIRPPKTNFVDTDEGNPSSKLHKRRDKWLRVYPARKAPDETITSVAFRCLVSQIGLVSLLVLWSVIFVIVIHFYEGPFEQQVTEEFNKEQTKLVIDLATELRQITPLSSKWRTVIENRIEEARKQTVLAVGRGARTHPGQFWNLSGTFLFGVYVMTALGFGAPVPQTTEGRTAAIIYAAVAVPVHLIILVNVSACVVARVEAIIKRVRAKLPCVKKQNVHSTRIALEGPSRSSNFGVINSTTGRKLRKKLLTMPLRLLASVCVGRCVPLAAILYYAIGAVSFGVLRSKKPLEMIMFPLEFTTSGGLEHVEEHVRVLYAVYVEGAMALLACGLATLGRHSDAAMEKLSQKYRMFVREKRRNIRREISKLHIPMEL